MVISFQFYFTKIKVCFSPLFPLIPYISVMCFHELKTQKNFKKKRIFFQNKYLLACLLAWSFNLFSNYSKQFKNTFKIDCFFCDCFFADKKVLVTVFDSISSTAAFSSITGSSTYINNNYNYRGYTDDFAIIPYWRDYSAIRMETYFVAPYTG